jgi:hypothetical protein
MTLNNRVVHLAAREHIGERVTHQFANAQLTLRASAGTTVTMMLFVPCHYFQLLFVAPAFVPGTHAFLQRRKLVVDGRDKPGRDGEMSDAS